MFNIKTQKQAYLVNQDSDVINDLGFMVGWFASYVNAEKSKVSHNTLTKGSRIFVQDLERIMKALNDNNLFD
jgi:hypothetical protein